MKIHQHNAGHMTKMAAMPLSGKITLKVIKFFMFCSNHDPGLTLTYFIARSNFAT